MKIQSILLSQVKFSNMTQWDVKQFFFSKLNSNYPIVELGKHLIHHTEKICPSDYPDDDFAILGVSNKIGMFDASIEKGKSIKQKYHIVKENWLAYNPYRINVGSIGIKTSDLKGNYISPAYVVFSCKDTILPEYLWLMMKSDLFSLLIKDSTTGSVRQTLSYEKLAAIKAPVPSITEQERILKEYHELLDKAEAEVVKGDKYGLTLLKDIQSEVSNLNEDDLKADDTASILSTVSFTATDRWEVGYIYKQDHLDKINNSFKYDSKSISDLEPESLFGLSIKSSLEQKKGLIPMLRMTNIVNGEVDYSELKYVPAEEASSKTEVDKWILHNGDFLVTRTNGSKDLVGKAAVFKNTETFTYASYLIRYRFDNSIILTDYVNIMFLLPIVREQIAVMRRQGGGQYNLNSDEIGAIRIPVPSIPEQQRIIDRFNNQKDGANKYYEKAEEFRKRAKIGFENEIFN